MENVTGYNKRTMVMITLLVGTICSLGLTVLAFFTEFHTSSHLFFEITIVWVACVLLAIIFQKVFNRHLEIIEQVLHSTNDAIIVKDYQSKFLFCNDTAAKLYETLPEKMIGKDDFYFTGNKEQSDFFYKNTQAIMDEFKKSTVSETFTDKHTGEVSHYLSLKVPFRDVRGKLKIIVFARDITQITRLKEKADKNKQRLQQVLEVSQEGLWEWNTQTNDVFHNPKWEAIMGIESSKNTFTEFFESILPEDKAMVEAALQALMESNAPYNIEFRMRRGDGKVIWVWDRGGVAEYDEHGKAILLAGIVLDITEKKINQQQVERLAYFDPLTGLHNRAQLECVIKQTIAKKQDDSHYSAVLFLDLDRFKLLNDSYGHHMGDQLLKKVAQRLASFIHPGHFLGRFGGDEFIIVCPSIESEDEVTALSQVNTYANQVIHAVGQSFILNSGYQEEADDCEDIEYDIAVSVGGIVFNSPQVSMGYLVQLADIAMYRAKMAGGQQAKIFTLDSQNELTYNSHLIRDMRSAMQQKNFHIFLQPKVSAEGKLIGSEALVRWLHPERGVLVPESFIDQAEECNLIIQIGQQVLELACQKLKHWQQDEDTKHLTIAINLSAKQLWQSHFVEQFTNTVASYHIDTSKLIVEVTESLLIQDIKDATEKLSALKNTGIKVSLDDFGTGYSSLNYLHRLPIDEIKIDRSFVQDSTQDPQTELMVKSIIELAKNFNLSVVAEGVETPSQFALLKRYGVNVYQGYLFAKPLSDEDFTGFMARNAGAISTLVAN